MTISDPDQTPLDPDTGAPQEPVIDDGDGSDALPGDDVLDQAADGDVLADPDIDLDETPRGSGDAA